MGPRVLIAALALACASASCGPDQPPLPPDAERRLVPLEGSANFRDLGGYRARDGRSVRWGQLYRSDALDELTPGDVEIVRGLGIRLVCDFRSDAERAEAPDRLPAEPAPEVALLSIGGDGTDPADLRERITSGDLGDLDLENLLIEGNRAFVTDFSARYRDMFARISVPENRPALVHCTAGKDRAGFASALLLRALGVPAETVYEDYLLTNVYTAERVERSLFLMRLFSLFRTDPERVRPLLEARRPYLEAAFATIEAQFGSFDAFLRGPLGVSDEARAALQASLLE